MYVTPQPLLLTTVNQVLLPTQSRQGHHLSQLQSTTKTNVSPPHHHQPQECSANSTRHPAAALCGISTTMYTVMKPQDMLCASEALLQLQRSKQRPRAQQQQQKTCRPGSCSMQSSPRSWSQWWLTAEGEEFWACRHMHLKEQQQQQWQVTITPALLVHTPGALAQAPPHAGSTGGCRRGTAAAGVRKAATQVTSHSDVLLECFAKQQRQHSRQA